ncbi:MAG TPA: thioredoxin family protein [Candidatus Fermentibacter daniensis]|nr:MAG: hypothetical protein AO395_02440 [Candidatus Fermentibacter daniensis]MCC6872528.1 thioredoxin family protein [Candidatus Fermentibacter sp.]KZD19569.1 MAG: hypothetical protein AO394_02155 [Candidatus Fermentibacter daniensis]KZD19732.1 MAG: hypothetical protein AO396_01575 [Candidatus Fermentibacter daniensis]NLI02579.1 hypothetical protein [Candidatus Fermentibacter daniensis]
MTDSKTPVKVLVIGTEPPCPRCALLCRMVEQAAADGTPVELDHCAFEDEKAGKLAERYGRRVGTAKHVSKASGIELDGDAVRETIESARKAAGPGSDIADAWTPRLDELLDPCTRAADSVGYYMTPVLVVDGVVVHHGSVPSKEQLRELLRPGR